MTTKDTDWEIEFDKQFSYEECDHFDWHCEMKDIKNFLKETLHSKEKEIREELAEKVDGLRRDLPTEEAIGSGQGMYNHALDDILQALSKLQDENTK